MIEVNIEGAVVNGKRFLVEGRAEQVCAEMVMEYVRLQMAAKNSGAETESNASSRAGSSTTAASVMHRGGGAAAA